MSSKEANVDVKVTNIFFISTVPQWKVFIITLTTIVIHFESVRYQQANSSTKVLPWSRI